MGKKYQAQSMLDAWVRGWVGLGGLGLGGWVGVWVKRVGEAGGCVSGWIDGQMGGWMGWRLEVKIV